MGREEKRRGRTEERKREGMAQGREKGERGNGRGGTRHGMGTGGKGKEKREGKGGEGLQPQKLQFLAPPLLICTPHFVNLDQPPWSSVVCFYVSVQSSERCTPSAAV